MLPAVSGWILMG